MERLTRLPATQSQVALPWLPVPTVLWEDWWPPAADVSSCLAPFEPPPTHLLLARIQRPIRGIAPRQLAVLLHSCKRQACWCTGRHGARHALAAQELGGMVASLTSVPVVPTIPEVHMIKRLVRVFKEVLTPGAVLG